MKFKFALIPALVVLFAGCSVLSTLATVAAWSEPLSTTFSAIVGIVTPSNTKLPADADAIVTLLSDISTDADAAKAAGGSAAGVEKVIADIQAFTSDISGLETDLSALGVNLSAADKGYINDVASIALIAAEGYEAVLETKVPAAGTTAELTSVRTSDGCAQFAPIHDGLQTVAYHITMNCAEPGDAIDVTLSAPVATTVSYKKPPTVDNFKRQLNAIAKKYGKTATAKLNLTDRLKHAVSFGKF